MSFPRIASSLSRSWSQYRTYQRAVTELSALGDRSLEDIGIIRSDIEHFARRAAI